MGKGIYNASQVNNSTFDLVDFDSSMNAKKKYTYLFFLST